MTVLAILFIGAFWFALSNPPTLSRPSLATTASSSERGPVATTSNNSIEASEDDIFCDTTQVVDGDTLRCGVLRVRLASIDAPEMPGHCRRGRECVDGDPYASKAHLERLVQKGSVTCRQTDIDRYGRIVAMCKVNGLDLSCSQVRGGHAVIRYGDLSCEVG